MTITLALGGIFLNGIFYHNYNIVYTAQVHILGAQFIDWSQARDDPQVGLRILIIDENGNVIQITEPIVEILEAKAA